MRALAAVGALFVVASAWGQEQPAARYSTSIAIHLSCNDPALKNQILSSFSAEIRRLGDVRIVEAEKELPEFTLELIAINSRSRAGDDLGFALSVVVHRRLLRVLSQLAQSVDTKPTGEAGKAWTNSIMFLMMFGSEPITHEIRTGTADNIPNVAREVIADFDVKTLELDRKLWKETASAAKKMEEKAGK